VFPRWLNGVTLTFGDLIFGVLTPLPGFVKLPKGYTRLAAASDKVYQLLAHGQWFSPGTPASSTTKTG
jgi:hypothetical protein